MGLFAAPESARKPRPDKDFRRWGYLHFSRSAQPLLTRFTLAKAKGRTQGCGPSLDLCLLIDRTLLSERVEFAQTLLPFLFAGGLFVKVSLCLLFLLCGGGLALTGALPDIVDLVRSIGRLV